MGAPSLKCVCVDRGSMRERRERIARGHDRQTLPDAALQNIFDLARPEPSKNAQQELPK